MHFRGGLVTKSHFIFLGRGSSTYHVYHRYNLAERTMQNVVRTTLTKTAPLSQGSWHEVTEGSVKISNKNMKISSIVFEQTPQPCGQLP